MNDPIDRQKAIDVPERFVKDCNPEHFVGHQKFIEYMDNAEIGSFGNWQFANGFNMGLTAAEVAIKELPSAEHERTGKWLHDDNFYYETRFVCSECKKSECVPTIGFAPQKPLWDYCPNCGARMVDDE